ncbi:DUF3223 domain-containing protein [Bryobacter aggregatus]|uniref:DUF3223 domain-containing protein n=1 Tax=Bryobacter aggregatus TaxID=360054 RepID=UPI0009B5A97F
MACYRKSERLLPRRPKTVPPRRKIGCGLSHFEIMATEHGSKCFRLLRVANTFEIFSLKDCITGRVPSQ